MKKKLLIFGIITFGIIALLIHKKDNLYENIESDQLYNKIDNSIAVYIENDTDYERVDTIPDSGYVFNSSKSYCNESEVRDDTIKINYDMSTKQISITPIAKEKTKCYMFFDVSTTKKVNTVLGTIDVNLDTPDFSKTSCISGTNDGGDCGEETVGIYEVEDGMYGGTSYYWRGNVENNYVTFADKCWRIIRINGDGSIRLIYDGTICHANGTSTEDNIAILSQKYNESYDKSYFVGWSYNTKQHGTGTNSNAKKQVESWYNSNLASYADKITDGKYCNDRNIGSGSWSASGSTFYYATYTRLYTNKAPTLSCTNESDVFTTKIALITADEVAFAGGVYNTKNTSYYLYNGQDYYAMSPYNWNSGYSNASVFRVNSNGYLGAYYVNSKIGLRPVINIRLDITISSGDGTISTPYVFS